MKKLSLIIVILAFVMAAFIIIDEVKNKASTNDSVESPEDVAKLFEQSRTEAELCYLSAFASSDYDSYVFAFQNEVVSALAQENGVDYDTFILNVSERLSEGAEISRALYGDEYQVGYMATNEEKLDGAELEALKQTLGEYGVDTGLVKEAVRGYYSYILFNYGEVKVNEDGSPEYTFGEVPDDAELLYSSAFELTLYYVDNGEDGGWFVSPENF